MPPAAPLPISVFAIPLKRLSNLRARNPDSRLITPPRANLRTLVSKLVRGLIGPTPLSVLNYSSAQASRILAEILQAGSFDAVQIEGVHLSAYLPVIRSAASRPVILSDWHNIESEILHRYSRVHPNPAAARLCLAHSELCWNEPRRGSSLPATCIP